MIVVRNKVTGKYLIAYFVLLGNTMRFGQAMYSVNENDGIVQVMLNLSNPSSADTSVNVSSINQSANGKH